MSSKHTVQIGACDCKCVSSNLDNYEAGQTVVILTEEDMRELEKKIKRYGDACWARNLDAAGDLGKELAAILNPE